MINSILCSDWFIYNITNYINTTDLCNLKFANKYYDNYITKSYILNTVDKNIKQSTESDMFSFILNLETTTTEPNQQFVTNCQGIVKIPMNTLWEISACSSPMKIPFVLTICCKIKNVLGEINIYDFCKEMSGEHYDIPELSMSKNELCLSISPNSTNTDWVSMLKIRSTSF